MKNQEYFQKRPIYVRRLTITPFPRGRNAKRIGLHKNPCFVCIHTQSRAHPPFVYFDYRHDRIKKLVSLIVSCLPWGSPTVATIHVSVVYYNLIRYTLFLHLPAIAFNNAIKKIIYIIASDQKMLCFFKNFSPKPRFIQTITSSNINKPIKKHRSLYITKFISTWNDLTFLLSAKSFSAESVLCFD